MKEHRLRPAQGIATVALLGLGADTDMLEAALNAIDDRPSAEQDWR